MRKIFTILVILVLKNSFSYAVSIEDALVNAYNENDELKIARRTFLDEIEQFPQALSGFLPDITGSVRSTTSKNKSKSQFDTTNGLSRETKSLDNNLSIVQPIFSGGSSVGALRAAQSAFRSSRGKYYASEQKVILGAIQAYLDYYQAKEAFGISETSVKNNQIQLDALEERVKVGESTETDLAGAKASFSAAETNRLTAYANMQTAKANFIRIFKIEPSDIVDPSIPEELPKDFDELIKRSLSSNPSIQSARHGVLSSKASEMIAKAPLLPQVNFTIQGGRTFFDPENQGNNSQNSSSVTSAISVQVPIYPKGGAQYSTIRKAKNQTRSLAIQFDDQINQTKANCMTSWEGYNAAKSAIISATQGVEAAQKAYDGKIQEELVGSSTPLDVSNAEEKLNNAKLSKVKANRDCIFAAYQMKSLIGALTAKSLKLKVNYFSPEDEFKKVKTKIIGF